MFGKLLQVATLPVDCHRLMYETFVSAATDAKSELWGSSLGLGNTLGIGRSHTQVHQAFHGVLAPCLIAMTGVWG